MAAINTSSPPRPADEAPSSDILWRRNAGLGVFAGGFASLCLAGFASGRLRRREAPAMPALQLVVTAAEDGLTFDDGNGRNRFRWSYFLGFMESEKSFVLQGDKISATQCLLKIVPKSAFATEDELLEFRALLAQKILPEARRV